MQRHSSLSVKSHTSTFSRHHFRFQNSLFIFDRMIRVINMATHRKVAMATSTPIKSGIKMETELLTGPVREEIVR